MIPAVRFRKFQQGDSRRLHAIINAAVRHACTTAYTPHQIDIWTNHQLGPDRFEDYARRGYRFLLAIDEDTTIIGFAGWCRGELRMLYVLPTFQRCGLGSELLRLALAQAKTEDDPILEVNASLTAENFYARHGFRREVENRPPPSNIPYVYMVRDED